jgi:NAD(P)H-flavin reductase
MGAKDCCVEPLLDCKHLSHEYVMLKFAWNGTAPRAGQFFMLRPELTPVLLGRPLSVADWNANDHALSFLVQLRGPGTRDLAGLKPGDKVQLTGPLGKRWHEVARVQKKIALISGGVGIAPLLALTRELSQGEYKFFSGFRTLPCNDAGQFAFQDIIPADMEPFIATDDGSGGKSGSVLDYIDPFDFEEMYVCGSVPLIQAAAAKAAEAHTRCIVSMEHRMACGVGACMGCTVRTINGNRRCCADGPIFDAAEVLFG